jgi:filamentous hemagglutinin family protein
MPLSTHNFCAAVSLALLASGFPLTSESAAAAEATLIAQLVPDTSLGAESSVVTPGVPIRGDLADEISGGAIRDTNLFHSFTEFNILNGQRVYFANPIGIDNILSRVTGGNLSNIDGLLGVDGTANLFLMNPNGILFGPNARLDIQGTFTATTVNSLRFADGSEFSATPTENELLRVSVPLGVQFNTPPQGNIMSTGSLVTGQDLTLQGENLSLAGQLQTGADLTLHATDTVTIRDTDTEAFVARAGEALTIQGNQGIDILVLQHLDQTPLVSGGDLTLVSDGNISTDAHFASGGNLQFISLTGEPANLVSLYDPTISADGDVVFGDYTGVALKVEASGSIQGGDITITGPDTTLTADGSGSDEDLLASRRAAILRAGVNLAGAPNVPQGIFNPGTIAAPLPGSIIVASIDTSNDVGGDGGPIILEASGNITPLGRLDSGAFSADKNSGAGGTIELSAIGEINILGDISSSSFSPLDDAGAGGAIVLSANGDINIEGRLYSGSESAIGVGGNSGPITLSSAGNIAVAGWLESSSTVFWGVAGTGGAITLLSAGNIDISGQLDSSTHGRVQQAGNGGAIMLSAGGSIDVSGRLDAESSVYAGFAGDGGKITLSAAESIDIPGTLHSNSRAAAGIGGNGGDIALLSMETINISGNLDSGSSSGFGNAGNGGAITLSSAGHIDIFGELESSSAAESDAGNGGKITLSSNGNIATEGDLRSLSFSENGTTGNGGEIQLDASQGNILGLPGTRLLTLAFSNSGGHTGAAGRVNLNAKNQISGLEILTLASAGDAGDVTIQSWNGLKITGVSLTTSGQVEFPNPFNPSGPPIIISLDNIGQSGDASISSPGQLTLENVRVLSDANGPMPGGDITVTSPVGVNLINSELNTDTNSGFSTGTGGSITFYTPSVTVDSDSAVTARASAMSTGTRGGSIAFNSTSPLIIQGTGEIASTTESDSQAGSLAINAPQVTIDGAQLSTSTSSDGTGGNVTLNTNQVIFENGGGIEASTSGAGQGGDVRFIPNRDTLRLSGDGEISVSTTGLDSATQAAGDAGGFSINVPHLIIDRVRLAASTQGDGDGGTSDIQATTVTFANNGEIAATTAGSGAGGSLTVSGNSPLTLQGNGRLTVASLNANSGVAGNLNVNNASELFLRDGIELSVNSASSAGGGNIVIDVDGTLLMTGGSYINATSTNPNAGDGGNVTINLRDGFLIAPPGQNNDIIANAVGGNGGRVEVNAINIFGFSESRGFTTNELRANTTNDLSASSAQGVEGEIALNVLNLDPSSGLGTLPEGPIDASQLIEQTLCEAGQGSNFVVTGRGGLPSVPTDALDVTVVWEDWQFMENIAAGETAAASNINSAGGLPNVLVEAQGARRAGNDRIILLADPATATPNPAVLFSVNCRGVRSAATDRTPIAPTAP